MIKVKGDLLCIFAFTLYFCLLHGMSVVKPCLLMHFLISWYRRGVFFYRVLGVTLLKS